MEGEGNAYLTEFKLVTSPVSADDLERTLFACLDEESLLEVGRNNKLEII